MGVCGRQSVEFPSSDSREGSSRGSSLSCRGKGALFTSRGLGKLSAEPRFVLCLQGCCCPVSPEQMAHKSCCF